MHCKKSTIYPAHTGPAVVIKSRSIKIHLKTSVKRFRQVFKKINKFKMRISVPYVGVMAPKAENTFFTLHISILVKSKNYFAIVFKFLCGF